jgi:hypothetical protein
VAVVVWAEFEEKTYEVAADSELVLRGAYRGLVFSPGQVLEEFLGYDVAAATDPAHPIWALLRVRRPSGVRLLPNLWSGGPTPRPSQLPVTPISRIFQYKRPEFLRNGRARQWQLWRRPYFRFTRTGDQHTVLRRIERRLAGDAIVRYAAPAFWTMADLEGAVVSGGVLAQSGFVSPEVLGGHVVWTYSQPGNDGYGNPRSRRLPFQSIEDLRALSLNVPAEVPLGLIVREPGLRSHIHVLAEAVPYGEPRAREAVERWIREIRATGADLSDDVVGRVRDLASISTVLARIGSTWLLTDRT